MIFPTLFFIIVASGLFALATCASSRAALWTDRLSGLVPMEHSTRLALETRRRANRTALFAWSSLFAFLTFYGLFLHFAAVQ